MLPGSSITIRPRGPMLRHLLILSPLVAAQIGAQTYYVSTTGSDSNSGTSLTSPFRHLGYGASRLSAGDALLLRGGTYEEYAAIIGKKGRPDARILIANYNGETVVVRGSTKYCVMPSGYKNDGFSVFYVRGCEYLTIQAITFDGRSNDTDTTNRGTYWKDTCGISIGSDLSADLECVGISVKWCTMKFNGLNGLAAQASDQVIVDGCWVFGNGKTSSWGGSGISFYRMKNKVDPGSTFYRNQILNCTSNGNVQEGGVTTSDGDGIAIDGGGQMNETWSQGTPVLVKGNTCRDNGSFGMYVYNENDVTFDNNTTSGNGTDSRSWRQGEIGVLGASRITVKNNDCTQLAGKRVLYIYKSPNQIWYQNQGNNFHGGLVENVP